VVGEPESVESARAPAALAPSPVGSVGAVAPVVVAPLAVVVVLRGGEGFVPGVVAEPVPTPVPAVGVDPVDEPGLPGRAGVVAAGLGFGVGVGGRLDEEDGLGFGDGLGATAAGGGLLGAPPEPNANPMTVAGAGL
jgi:hypothetical protein